MDGNHGAHSTSCDIPLMYGCVGGHEEIVRILIDIGPNVEFYIEIDCTPLIKATSAGHINIAKVLLEHKNGIST